MDEKESVHGELEGRIGRVSAAIAGVLVDYGYTEAKLGAEAALVDAVRAKLQNHAHESGAAQESTVGRDKKIAELDQWVSDLRAIMNALTSRGKRG